MARSFVKTNRRRLDAFFREGGKIDDLVLRVGQLSGKPKYAPGHVGSKSRGARRTTELRQTDFEKDRRRQIRAGRAYLQSIEDPNVRRSELKRLRRQIKEAGAKLGTRISTKGLGRKVTAGTAVARVAGVLASRSGYHVLAIKQRRGQVVRELDQLREALLGRGSTVRALKVMGRNAKRAIRQRYQATGHVDTGKVLRNIQYEIVDQATKKRKAAEARAARAKARAQKKARR